MTNLTRFKHYVVKNGMLDKADIRATNPIPICSQDKLIGFANVYDDSRVALIEGVLSPSTPERLELELESRTYYLDAKISYRGLMNYPYVVANVESLTLTTEPIKGQMPLSLKEL